MKKLLFAVLFIFIFSLSANASYDIIVDIKQNGEYVESDIKGMIINNRVFVPVRYAAIALGIENVTWEEKDKEITMSDGETTLVIFAGDTTAYINGQKTETDISPVIIDSRTYVPVRFLAEIFKSKVEWQEDTYAVNIENDLSLSDEKKNSEYDDTDIYWLSRIIEAESKGEPIEGKIAVGNVILNRRESPDFPDSIYEVIFQKAGGKFQFTPVKNNTIYNTPSKDSLIAAKHALNDTDIAGEALFFLNPETAKSSWVINNRIYFITVHNHDFYL